MHQYAIPVDIYLKLMNICIVMLKEATLMLRSYLAPWAKDKRNRWFSSKCTQFLFFLISELFKVRKKINCSDLFHLNRKTPLKTLSIMAAAASWNTIAIKFPGKHKTMSLCEWTLWKLILACKLDLFVLYVYRIITKIMPAT